MADLVSDGGEFSCNFCTTKLKLSVIKSSTCGDSKQLANQSNCLLPPPPGGMCSLLPGPPVPCTGAFSVTTTGQSTVKIDGQTALGDGCQFLCTKGQPVSLSKAGQEVAKHDEASSGVGAYIVGGILVVGGTALVIALLPEEAVAAAAAGVGLAAKAVGKLAAKVIKKVATKTKNAFKKPKTKTPPNNKPNSNSKPPANDNNKPYANDNKPPPGRGKKGSADKSLPKDPFNDPKYENVSNPKAAEKGHYQFRDKDTGEIVNFDKGKPGASGHEGFDHYHRVNPNRTSKLDHYLDGQGNPVPKGSDASHIYPERTPNLKRSY